MFTLDSTEFVGEGDLIALIGERNKVSSSKRASEDPSLGDWKS
jgi:hypothetical protein